MSRTGINAGQVDPAGTEPGPADARVFDALTRGDDNISADREVASRLEAADPRVYWWAVAHWHFRRQAMIALADAGFRQWIDLGCGLPNAASAYDLLATDPALGGGRLVCVDNDPIVITHLQHRPPPATGLHVAAVLGDLRDPDQVMADIVRLDVVDLGEPVAVLLTAVLHHLDDPAAGRLLAVLRDYVVAGSVLVVSHPSSPPLISPPLRAAAAHYQRATGAHWTLRAISTAPDLLGPWWIPHPPGITPVGRWHPASADPNPGDDQDPPELEALRAAPGWAVLAAACSPPQATNDAASVPAEHYATSDIRP
ncbi:hypothetical protein DMB66_32790 [Actinoplanes sp. ATCC 53533]|uniref:SAM-dependent methyltransferase n=1 Tax=Actinoplanes sp. ATCC 53533 TaxID=1288362 RepID=UPI000F771DAC|nr:SAM-dependent methyltransferase [Actinoplanes sp. ATCC 53533]RSM56799.1 hypothetical protein DMB66_32790 [Actinoplanes sp. ATCC 53533]